MTYKLITDTGISIQQTQGNTEFESVILSLVFDASRRWKATNCEPSKVEILRLERPEEGVELIPTHELSEIT